MRAVVYDRYGPPSALRVDDVAIPTPAPGQVLVRIAATSVNLSDWETLRGSPMYARLGGLRSPARRTLGSDIAGRVEAVGQGVTRFRTGDQVYGDNLALKGGFAEYAVAAESALAHKPAELTFAQASTIPQAGAIALQGTAGAAAGHRVLINGAGGGSGSFAVQLAKRLGAHVTGVDNAAKLTFMRALGANAVIDYREEDFTQSELSLRLDPRPGRVPVGVRLPPCTRPRRPLSLRRRAHASAGAGDDRRLDRRPTTNRRMGILAVRTGPAHFEALADLCIAGNVAIHIDRTFGLDEVPDALAYVGDGHALGKVVVMIDKAAEEGQNTNQRSLH